MTLVSGPGPNREPASELLKLDNDFSLSRKGLKVDTVLFDAATDKARSNSIFARIFGKLMEWRAKGWVRDYVIKNKEHLPNYDNFLKNINSSGGVKRSDFMNLLAEARINRSPIFLQTQKNTTGLNANLLLGNAEESLVGYFSRLGNPTLSENSVRIFFDFIDRGDTVFDDQNIQYAVEFLDGFRRWCNQSNEIISLECFKGRVNLFHAAVEERISYVAGLNDFNSSQKLAVPQPNNVVSKSKKHRKKPAEVSSNTVVLKKYLTRANDFHSSGFHQNFHSLSLKPLAKDAQRFHEQKNKKEMLDMAFINTKTINVCNHIVMNILKNFELNRIPVSYFLDYIQSGSSVINSMNYSKIQEDGNESIKKFLDNIRGTTDEYVFDCLMLVHEKFSKDVRCFSGDSYKNEIKLPASMKIKK